MNTSFDNAVKTEQDPLKKPYTPPQVEVLNLDKRDVMSTSNPNPWEDEGEWDFNNPGFHP